jgi:hypothetical protein
MTGRPVVIGIIDDGIAFAQARVRVALAQSRVEYWWLQDGPWSSKPGALSLGSELTKGQINALLTRCTHGGAVDEDELYQRAGLIDFHREGHNSAAWRGAHGTHVMDLACGYDISEGRVDRPIIIVQLPARTTADTSGGDLSYYADYAIKYILDRAQRIGTALGLANLPVVINFSYGKIAGPHDGTSEIERMIEDHIARAAARGVTLRVVLPAGNNYLARCHAQLTFDRPGRSHSLRWRIQPDDQTPSYLEIWMPKRPSGKARARVQLSVTTPTGQRKSITDRQGALEGWDSPAGIYAQMRYADMAAPTSRGLFLLTLRPTADLDPRNALAPSGVWTVTLTNKTLTPGQEIHAWIQRDDSLYGHPVRGRQSYFDDPAYRRFDEGGRAIEIDDPKSPVRRAGTLNAIATGSSPVVMGGYLGRETVAAPYSAAGPTASAAQLREGPDAMSVSERSRAHGGLLAAGARSGASVAMGGTSVAAPQIARWIADQLAAGREGNRDAVAARAREDEANQPPTARPQPSPTRGGAGRLRPPPGLLRRRDDG